MHEGPVFRGLKIREDGHRKKRLPHDGRIRVTTDEGKESTSCVHAAHLTGAKGVLSVREHRKGVPPLEELGFSAASLEELRYFLRHQHGMILVVGPTGSGKTTTLCSALTTLKTENSNIITLEDPVEYQLPGINQTQINDKIKLTFSIASSSCAGPDVICRQIRDNETPRSPSRSATGHIVLSTLHTDERLDGTI